MERAGPINCHYCPLSSEMSRYAGLYLVSVASLPHHLQATHLVFRPTLSEPKHFLLVTQPPRRAERRETESRPGKRERKSGTERTHHGIFPSFPPCSALVWSDSSPACPKGELLPGLCIARYPCSSSHSPLTLLESYFSVNCHILWRITQHIVTWSTWPISLLILWLVYIMELQVCSQWSDLYWFVVVSLGCPGLLPWLNHL